MLMKESAVWGRTKSDRAAADRERRAQAAVRGLPARLVDEAAPGPPLAVTLRPMERRRWKARTLAAVKPGAKPEPE